MDDLDRQRRRFLRISAVAAGAFLAGGLTARQDLRVRRWQGVALGAAASIEILGATGPDAATIFDDVEAELDRLENIFSLYRRHSVLSRLNAAGEMDAPPPELLEVLTLSRAVHSRTDGLFDPTVQPVFALYADQYAISDGLGVPSADELASALALVDLDAVAFNEQHIRFARSGMALTLNGIAQGYISDQIAQMLRRRGFSNVLVNMGEVAAVGAGLDGKGWRVGLADAAGRVYRVLRVSDRAVATSALRGTLIDGAELVGHIFHPRKGPVTSYFDSVSVVHRSAGLADAFSTAAALMTPAQIDALRKRAPNVVTRLNQVNSSQLPHNRELG